MLRRELLCILMFGVTFLNPYAAHANASADVGRTVWSVSGRTILLDGKPFFAKGVNYSPTPVGGSYNWDPFGDWFTRSWRGIYQRDLPLIRAMGANAMRIHSLFAFPPTDANYENVDALDFDSPEVADHLDFLDKAWDGGQDPLYVLITIPVDKLRGFYQGDDRLRAEDSERVYRFYKKLARWAARKYGSHPAVMGFSIGNECNDALDLPGAPVFWERIDELARIVKAEAPDKLVTSVWFPQPKEHFLKYPRLLLDKRFDVIGMNLYDGPLKNSEFWELYNSWAQERGLNKPVIVTEFGTPACRHGVNGRIEETAQSALLQVQWALALWKQIADRSVLSDPGRGITSGGFVFAWSDEWWKTRDQHGHAAIQDPGKIQQDFLAGGWLDDECFGINSIAPHPDRPPLHPWEPDKSPVPYPPDLLTPRPIYYALKALWK
ncbi:MAG: hypothetical protein FJ118_12785 [Deltaproteobacteria bacterium]|nr:hypothetical protein [Deltaproteobacteria bacterium]